MSVGDLVKHKEFIDMMDDLETSSERDYELMNKTRGG